MPRYIDADTVVKRFDEIQPFAGNKAANAAINLCKDIVQNAPTISPDDARGVGKWIKYAPHNSDMMVCSACEKYWILDGDQYDYRFCPNCGAKMEVSEDA